MPQSQPHNGRVNGFSARRRVRYDGNSHKPASGSGLAVWREVDKAAWDRLVCASLDAGALTSLNTSSDGGVLHTHVLHGSNQYDTYSRNAEEAEQVWALWTDSLNRHGYIPIDHAQ